MTDRQSPNNNFALTGVAETLLWPLWTRTTEARKLNGFFDDPIGIALIDHLDYDFAKFGRPNGWHAVRSKFSDNLIRRFLAAHPHGTVVALGEGLETQFWRTDNGSVHWISVDLPDAIAVRRRFLPPEPRNSLIACSALDAAWMDAVSAAEPVFVSAAGLLMYFTRPEVEGLLRAIAERLPNAELFCDLIPPWLSRRTLKGLYTTRRYRTPAMPFGLGIDDIPVFLAGAGGFVVLQSVTYPQAFPEWSPVGAAAMRIPWLRRHAPSLVHAHLRPNEAAT
ncbi:O-methyltransferase involved in polyketide biosynthesis [Rhodopseudomonas faecalis]|uniref:O-methyltransferase involved in polyketide biosynthesis n=1 Tax=Rhodopseudomonas faecalis TaxID=99655 RepID=A0A318TGF4_9BRAD|nr:class I SAM-dependent methyltransferase [Rhodopseudomonas faecalis]PYF02228.1 O-methyltransferase involved in polyketide biosynthesis [Rhodopseudomonas faecalis]TAH64875.1 MAG: class I SAM-dependent methyltransferase [Rhodopseudomonas palustris]